MIKNKRAQFFLLAAVIISAIVISFGVTTNRATVSSDRPDIEGYSYEVQREIGAVFDYIIYTNFTDPFDEDDLHDFVRLLGDDIMDEDPDADFFFIYGNNESLTVLNYASENIIVDDQTIEAIEVTVSSTGTGTARVETTTREPTNYDLVDAGNSVDIESRGTTLNFDVGGSKEVIFVYQKNIGDESYVTYAG